MSVVIETTIGDITIDLYTKERPRTCLNFLKLCKIKYYNFCLFHKIQKSFIAQTGDPTGTGRGGESVFAQLYGDQAKYFEAETRPKLKHKKLGTVSMVNNGSNMNGSQFFLTLGEDLTYLDDDHTVFGEVVEGFDILVKLNDAICGGDGRPYQDIRITHTVILCDPYDDPSGFEVPPSSPIPTKEILSSDYVGADEEIDDTKGRTIEEIEEEIKDKEAKARATILEMVGDIPDADVKPPETVLFVCKLNPVTTSEDLEIIFSRFGPIVSCEVIKDKKSGESLQYAFIEFEKEEDCENAYFKMDNVLIDDRRIHVDFSQSVSKLNYGKGNKGPLAKNIRDRDKFVIKNKSAKQDNYELIFDSDDDNKQKPQTPERKSNKKHSSKGRERSRSPSHKYKNRSPSPSRQRGRLQSPRQRNRSPNFPRRRSRSPNLPRQRSRSPNLARHRSRSPNLPRQRSRSPNLPRHRSRSPNLSRHKNRSPTNNPKHRNRTPSPKRSSSKYKSSSDSRSFHHKQKRRSRSSSPEYRKHRSSKKKSHRH